jgi:hypothetical protein
MLNDHQLGAERQERSAARWSRRLVLARESEYSLRRPIDG